MPDNRSRLEEALATAAALDRPMEENLRCTMDELYAYLNGDDADNFNGAHAVCAYEYDLAEILADFSDEELRSAHPNERADDELRRRQRERETEKAKNGDPAFRTRGKQLSDVTNADYYRPRFVWQGYLPRGKYSVLGGASGTGKSTLALTIAALISSGAPLPGETAHREPERVVIFSAEDELGKIAYHLNAKGAKGENVRIFDVDACEGITVSSPCFAAELRDYHPALVIIDPWQSFTGDARLNSMEDVRRLTTPLRGLAIELDAAFLIVAHLGKGSGNGDGSSRISGSSDLVNGARSVMIVEQIDDVENEDNRIGIIISTKSSDSKPPKSWLFRIPGTGGVDFVRTSRIDRRAFESAHDKGKTFARTVREESADYDRAEEIVEALTAELGNAEKRFVSYGELRERHPGIFGNRPSNEIEVAAASLRAAGIVFKTTKQRTEGNPIRGIELRRDWTVEAAEAPQMELPD